MIDNTRLFVCKKLKGSCWTTSRKACERQPADAPEYKHSSLGLIFVKYVSDFSPFCPGEQEDQDYYNKINVFYSIYYLFKFK